jgi:ribosomal protein L20
MHALKKANIGLDRKILSDLAIADQATFTSLVQSAAHGG